MIRVLIVEDSAVERALLTHILESDSRIQVVGVAEDGEKALSAVEHLKPDVITMDIHMPNLNGFDTTRRIMECNPAPVIIVSGSYVPNDVSKTFRAIEAGALAVVRKPRGIGHPDYLDDAWDLIRTVKAMSEVKVVKRWPRADRKELLATLTDAADRQAAMDIRIVAVGASTGGPPVLHELFSALPKDLSAPLMVVQHMATGFMDGFVSWLSSSTGFPAHVATHGEQLLPGHAYFAPDGFHLLAGVGNKSILSADLPENGLRPSVARLFRSVAETFGPNSMGILLTGMGRDGADDLRLLKAKGAVTVAQDQESSIIFGMPGEAVRLSAADYILPPARIAGLLAKLVKS